MGPEHVLTVTFKHIIHNAIMLPHWQLLYTGKFGGGKLVNYTDKSYRRENLANKLSQYAKYIFGVSMNISKENFFKQLTIRQLFLPPKVFHIQYVHKPQRHVIVLSKKLLMPVYIFVWDSYQYGTSYFIYSRVANITT